MGEGDHRVFWVAIIQDVFGADFDRGVAFVQVAFEGLPLIFVHALSIKVSVVVSDVIVEVFGFPRFDPALKKFFEGGVLAGLHVVGSQLREN